MGYNDWSNTTQTLLNGSAGTQISFGEIRAAIGDTTASISARELHRVTDLDAPYDFNTGKYPSSTGQAHLPYVLDATENIGVGTTGALSPQDVRGVIQEYVLEQDPNTEEDRFDIGTLSPAGGSPVAVNWNSNLNKNITKYLRVRGRMKSEQVNQPAVSIASSASSNLNVYVHNSPSSYGVYGAGGQKNPGTGNPGQPGGHAVNVANPGAPASRVVYVECEGSTSRIYGGGGGGADGADGSNGSPGTGAASGSPGSPGSKGPNGSPGSPGGSGQPGQPGSGGQQRSTKKWSYQQRRTVDQSRRQERRSRRGWWGRGRKRRRKE